MFSGHLQREYEYRSVSLTAAKLGNVESEGSFAHRRAGSNDVEATGLEAAGVAVEVGKPCGVTRNVSISLLVSGFNVDEDRAK